MVINVDVFFKEIHFITQDYIIDNIQDNEIAVDKTIREFRVHTDYIISYKTKFNDESLQAFLFKFWNPHICDRTIISHISPNEYPSLTPSDWPRIYKEKDL